MTPRPEPKPHAAPSARRSDLRREITRLMTTTVLVVVVGILSSSYLVYALMLQLYPDWEPSQGYTPMPLEWMWMALVTIISIGLAVAVSVLLTRRIAGPLHSVADALRRIAHGELSVRASAGQNAPSEAVVLVDDFNTMAQRFEQLQQDSNVWNAAIAHELRTPLTILRGRLQGLADGVFQPNEAQFRSLLIQVEGLSRLVEDLRALSLADNSRLELTLDPVDLVALVQSVAELHAPAVREAGGTLTVQLPPVNTPSLTWRCDAVRIRQALIALLDNAIRHAMPGPISLQLQVPVDGAPDSPIVLAVEDQGPGLDPDAAERVFEPFIRGPAAHRTHRSGSGLGLAVVRAIAQAHGGQAVCRPGASGGCRFEMQWPMG